MKKDETRERRNRLSGPLKKIFFLFSFAALFFSVAGCRTLPEQLPADVTMIHQVPFFEQEDFQCGPAALATVINYWFIKTKRDGRITVESITRDIYSKAARGVLGVDLELYARKHGFDAVQLNATMEDIRAAIDNGVPVIVLVDFGKGPFHQNHFMVAKGYYRDGMIFNSGRRENYLMTGEAFARIWKRASYWALFIKP